jgi:PAS domain S-box-containing protein
VSDDRLDLMSPEAIARLRHALRTPLNQLIGYAGMAADEARGQGNAREAKLIEEALGIARKIADRVQQALPQQSHIAEDAFPALREVMRPALDRIGKLLSEFEHATGGMCAVELRKMRSALAELALFARAGEPPPAPSAAQRRAAGPGGRILVVDDDADNRQILARRLEREGFTAVTDASGGGALERLAREQFDLVLLDLSMPGMNGFQVLERMKAEHTLEEIPVIVLSAFDDQDNVVRSIEMGAEDFLGKPFDPVVLRARIGAVLRRRRAEAERAEIAERLKLLLESTGEGVFGQDREGRCTFVNRAALAMLGLTQADLLGRDLHAVIHRLKPDGSPYPAEECPIRAVLRTGEARSGQDEMLVRADGSMFPIEYSAHPIERGGRQDGVVVTFTDISERKQAEERLLESAKLEGLGVLAGGIAHDFNNILTGILGNASLVLDTIPAGHENHTLLTEVVAAGERAADLTRQMLAFAGKGQFVIEPVDLSKAIQNMAELLGATLPKGVRLSLKLANDLPPVHADAQQIQQLTFNLVINAGEAIGDRPGTVTISTGIRDFPEGAPPEPPFGSLYPGRHVFAAVEDTGSGMDAATRARAFEPFFSTKFTGRGLGLAAAMGIARVHGGAIRVATRPGEGSRFEVLLPAMRRQAIPLPPATLEAVVARTILVVDDEEIVRRTARAVLERKGYRVLAAENGQEAVNLFRERSAEISLILLDLTMPVMGGEEAARALQAIRQDVPILVLSGYNESEVARRFAGSRVAGVVRKPYTAASLVERIEAALAAPIP